MDKYEEQISPDLKEVSNHTHTGHPTTLILHYYIPLLYPTTTPLLHQPNSSCTGALSEMSI